MAGDKKPRITGADPFAPEPAPAPPEPPAPDDAEGVTNETREALKESVQVTRKNLEQLLAEYGSLAAEHRTRLKEWDKLISEKQTALESFDLDKADADQIDNAKVVLNQARELIAVYQSEAAYIGFESKYKDAAGAKFLDKEVIKKYGPELQKVMEDFIKIGDISAETMATLRDKGLVEGMGFASEAELKQFISEAAEASLILTAADLQTQDQSKETGLKKFARVVGSMGGNMGAGMAVSYGVGMVLTGGWGIAATATFMAGSRAYLRFRGNKKNIGKYKDKVRAGIESADIGSRYQENMLESIRVKQYERLAKKEEKEPRNQTLEDIREAYVRGEIKDRDALRQEFTRALDSFDTQIGARQASLAQEAELGVVAEADAEQQAENQKEEAQRKQIEAAMQTLYMTEGAMQLEKAARETKVAVGGKKAKIIKESASGAVAKGAIQGAGYGFAGRVASRIPVLREIVAATGGAKLGAVIFEAAGGSKLRDSQGELSKWGKVLKIGASLLGAGVMTSISYFTGEEQKVFHDLMKEYHEHGTVAAAIKTGTVMEAGLERAFSLDDSRHHDASKPKINEPKPEQPPAGGGGGSETDKSGLLPGDTNQESTPPPDAAHSDAIYQQRHDGSVSESTPSPVGGRVSSETGGTTPAAASYAQSLEKMGFAKHDGKLSFDLAAKAQENPNLGNLEQVFDRVAASKYLSEFGKDHTLDHTEAAKILNISANLTHMAESDDAAFKEAAIYDAHTHSLTILDEAKFATLMDKLKVHADELANENKLGGAEEYIDNIRNQTWKEIVQSQETKIAVPEFPHHEHTAESQAPAETGHTGGSSTNVDVTSGGVKAGGEVNLKAALAEQPPVGADHPAPARPADYKLTQEPTIHEWKSPTDASETRHDLKSIETLTPQEKSLLTAYNEYQATSAGSSQHEHALQMLEKFPPEELSAYKEFNTPAVLQEIYSHKLGSELERGFMGIGGARSEVLLASTRELSRVAGGLHEGADSLFAHWLAGPDGVLKKNDLTPFLHNHEINLDAVKGKIDEFRNLAHAQTVPAGAGWEPRNVFITSDGHTTEALANIRCVNPHAAAEARQYEIDRDGDGAPDLRLLGLDKATDLLLRPEARADINPTPPEVSAVLEPMAGSDQTTTEKELAELSTIKQGPVIEPRHPAGPENVTVDESKLPPIVKAPEAVSVAEHSGPVRPDVASGPTSPRAADIAPTPEHAQSLGEQKHLLTEIKEFHDKNDPYYKINHPATIRNIKEYVRLHPDDVNKIKELHDVMGEIKSEEATRAAAIAADAARHQAPEVKTTVDPVDLSLRTMVPEGVSRDRILGFMHEPSQFQHGHGYTDEEMAKIPPKDWPEFMRFNVRETLTGYLEKPSNKGLEDLRIITTPELADKELGVGYGEAVKQAFKGQGVETLKAIQALVDKSVDASRQISQGKGAPGLTPMGE